MLHFLINEYGTLPRLWICPSKLHFSGWSRTSSTGVGKTSNYSFSLSLPGRSDTRPFANIKKKIRPASNLHVNTCKFFTDVFSFTICILLLPLGLLGNESIEKKFHGTHSLVSFLPSALFISFCAAVLLFLSHAETQGLSTDDNTWCVPRELFSGHNLGCWTMVLDYLKGVAKFPKSTLVVPVGFPSWTIFKTYTN